MTDKSVWNGFDPLNVTIKAEKDENGGRLIITDTGIGMSPEELTTNLGTLAKSGTSEFLAHTETLENTATSNLIGAFGLGFYSSFLVADRVHVASIPPKTSKNPEPAQYVFRSSADDTTFDIYPDPRGNTLGRGTEITLFMKPDTLEYLETSRLSALVHKHSAFTSSFPIYLFETWTENVPVEDETSGAENSPPVSESPVPESSDDEAIVEEVLKEDEKAPKTKTVTKEQWNHLNSQPPLWARDPKSITDEEYHSFYTSFFKDFNQPMAWHHFSGDSDGVTFKGILFLPDKLNDDQWLKPSEQRSADVRLMVKRVFITSDLGESSLPQWASWVKVVVDADDLPLNVSRETLQSNRFMKSLKRVIIKHIIQLFAKISEGDDTDLIQKLQKTYGSAFKLGAIEDTKNQEKLAALTSYTTNHRNSTTFDHYLEQKRKGQKQIFYLAEIGKKPEDLAESVFIEQLDARGYEVFLFTEPIDEVLIGHMRTWKGIPFQDAAKAGLKFGDEDKDLEHNNAQKKELEAKFQPLTEWLKKEAGDSVRDVILSSRLVKSPCAIIAETGGYTANVAKLMAASKNSRPHPMHEYAMKAKILEINPHSPLIAGLLNQVNNLSADEDQPDLDVEAELKEVASILIDGALVRSGYGVPDNNRFFTRIDRVLRRSLGVSESAKGEAKVKPAPERGNDDLEETISTHEGVVLPEELKDKVEWVDWKRPSEKHDEL